MEAYIVDNRIPVLTRSEDQRRPGGTEQFMQHERKKWHRPRLRDLDRSEDRREKDVLSR